MGREARGERKKNEERKRKKEKEERKRNDVIKENKKQKKNGNTRIKKNITKGSKIKEKKKKNLLCIVSISSGFIYSFHFMSIGFLYGKLCSKHPTPHHVFLRVQSKASKG